LQVIGHGSASTAATPAVVQSEPLQAAISSLQVSLDQAESLLDIEVTQEELASALELVPNHSFVRQLFNMADREGSGLCSFRGLEHILLTLSRGSHAAKLRLLFDLYDLNGSGVLEVEELTSMVRESLRVTDEYDSPDREARVEAEVAEALAAMYAKAGMMPGEQIDFDAFQIMMTAQANEGQAVAVGETAQPAAAGPTASSGHFLSPPPSVSVAADDSKSAEDSGALTKRSMLHRLLHRVQKSSRRRSHHRPSVVVGSSSAEPPKPRAAGSGHQRGSSAGGNSWSVSAAALSGDVPPSLSPASGHRHRRLDSHVVKTRERGAAAGNGVTGGPPSDEPSLPSLHPTRRSLPMQLRTYVNAHRAHIFILVLFYLICFGIFGERFWFFGYQIEHVGIRRVVQWSVPVTRGSASVIAFTMGVLLLTMCRNLLCYLQTTRAARFIPFQAALGFHVLVAYTCAAFMLGHVCGHMFNWYQIATQPNTDTMCYLPDVAYPSSFLPSFTFWIFQTPTNMIGVVLTLWMIFFYVVAMARQYIYTFFMHVHGKLFVVCYVLAVLHGMHQLFAYPLFWLFCLGPGLLFLFDRLWSFARVNAPLPVLSAQVLPSKVLKLTIARPAHVTYSSGQFLRLASDFLRRDEWHPFSVTSAPHQEHLSVHVRAVGPWTARLFQLYHPMHLQRRPVPTVASAALPPNALSAAPPQPSSSHSAAGARTPLDPLSPFSPPASTQSAAGGDDLAYPFASRTDMGAFMDKVPAGFVARASEFYLPPISVDGPFGGSHQGWSKVRGRQRGWRGRMGMAGVAVGCTGWSRGWSNDDMMGWMVCVHVAFQFRTVVLIGGGIGITPFASILQDFMQQVQMEVTGQTHTNRSQTARRSDADRSLDSLLRGWMLYFFSVFSDCKRKNANASTRSACSNVGLPQRPTVRRRASLLV
jgi:Ca2+-binding EF-hand superfamily protein